MFELIVIIICLFFLVIGVISIIKAINGYGLGWFFLTEVFELIGALVFYKHRNKKDPYEQVFILPADAGILARLVLYGVSLLILGVGIALMYSVGKRII